MSDLNNVGSTLRAMREKRDMSQRDLADRAGLRRHQISKWERADYLPNLKSLKRIADAMDTCPSLILRASGL